MRKMIVTLLVIIACCLVGVLISRYYHRSIVPHMQMSEPFIDLGDLLEKDGPAKRKVTIKNDGAAALELWPVGSTCGCARVSSIDNVIQPGQSGRVEVEVDPAKSLQGLNTQTITLATNVPSRRNVMLRLAWRVCSDADILVLPSEFTISVSRRADSILKCPTE